MRLTKTLVCLLLIPGCGDSTAEKSVNAPAVEVDLRPALPVQMDGYKMMTDRARATTLYVRDNPVVSLTDFSAAEAKYVGTQGQHLVKLTLTGEAEARLVEDSQQADRLIYAVVVDGVMCGGLYIDEAFDGTVSFMTSEALANAIKRAVDGRMPTHPGD